MELTLACGFLCAIEYATPAAIKSAARGARVWKKTRREASMARVGLKLLHDKTKSLGVRGSVRSLAVCENTVAHTEATLVPLRFENKAW
jgi:hypothetical protein